MGAFFFFSSASGFLCLLHTLVQPPLRVASGGLAGTRRPPVWDNGRVSRGEWGGGKGGLEQKKNVSRLKLQCLFGGGCAAADWLLVRDLGVKGVLCVCVWVSGGVQDEIILSGGVGVGDPLCQTRQGGWGGGGRTRVFRAAV